MKFNFRKIANVAASGALIGSTIALAAAATFPQPFVSESGASDVAVVYGDGATLDLGAVIDIENELAVHIDDSATPVGSGIPAGADWIKFEKSGSKLNMGDNFTAVYTTMELDDFEEDDGYSAEGIDPDDRILSETFEFDAADDESYDQKFEFDPNGVAITHFLDDYLDDFGLYEGSKVPVIGMEITDGSTIMNYTLFFDEEANCEDGFDTCEGEPIMIMGKQFWLLDFDNTSSTNHQIDFLDTSQTHSIKNDPPETIEITVDDVSITLEISTIDDDADPKAVTLIANGELQDEVDEGDTIELDASGIPDDVFLGVSDISANSQGLGTVQFSIGSGKLTIKNAQEVELNGKDLSDVDIGDDTNVYNDHEVWGHIGTTNADWDDLVIAWRSGSNELFLVPGMDVVLPGFDTVKLTMEGFTQVEGNAEEMTKFDPQDEVLELVINVKDGQVTLPVLYSNATDTNAIMGLGEDSETELATSDSATISLDLDEDTWWVASWINGDESESYVFEMASTVVDGVNTGDNKTEMDNLADDETLTFDDPGDDETLGNIKVTLDSHNDADETATFSVTSDSGSGTIHLDRIYTDEGLRILLPVVCDTGASCAADNDINLSTSPASFDFVIHEEDRNDNVAAGENFNATASFTGTAPNEVLTISAAPGVSFLDQEADSDDTRGYKVSELSTKLERIDQTDDHALEITYFGSETQADVYLTEAGEGSGGTTGGVLRLTDDDDIPTRHLLVVGGSCVNTLTAQLLGVSPATCGDAWSARTNVGPGQYLIESFARSGKTATVVAGWEMADTANAATFLTEGTDVETDIGDKYIGTTGTSADLIV